ncbi:RidA family protein [Fundicoccus ignavus]|uniref:RidA family protein n=1 Tax=Fundicoccus ignavus TaxID=2664442 RepID=A0A844CC84_9LACT|nr:RidA family protein [Fundicoccus ignavus]MRJ48483.1 RidA family protein [Fundicoccus ignavus]
MKKIESNLAPAAVGPYSQAIDTGNLVFLSGQLGIDRQTGMMVDGLAAQTHQAFRNIQYVLAEAGLTLANIAKVTVFLNDIQDFSRVNEIYASYFKQPYPARSAFQVAALPMNGLVEIEVIASKE